MNLKTEIDKIKSVYSVETVKNWDRNYLLTLDVKKKSYATLRALHSHFTSSRMS